MDINLIRPADLYNERPHSMEAQSTQYSLALAGLSQQAADAGVSLDAWIAQFSADAADGRLDGAAATSARALSASIGEFLVQPNSPFPANSAP